MDEWKKLFKHAVAHIEAANIPRDAWAFGGGTVLMRKFNHRVSKDIDIFIRDPQLLTHLSPRLNDALEAHITDYAEQADFVRVYLPQGEIDFICAKNVTACKPSYEKVEGVFCNVENPVEIIAKKIAYRGDTFRPRDIFDLALVFSECRRNMLEQAQAFAPYLAVLRSRLDGLPLDVVGRGFEDIMVLSGGEGVRGKELMLCLEFSKAVELEIGRVYARNGMEQLR